MRKTLIAALFAATLPAITMAMPGSDHEPDHHRGHGEHRGPFEQLDLTKEQREEMRGLMGEQMKSHREITQRYLDKLPENERKAMQDELQASKDKTHKQMRELLKPEQQKLFDEIHEKMEAKRAERAEFQKWKAERDQNKS